MAVALDIPTLARAACRRPRVAARAITLIESKRADHQPPRTSWCRSCCPTPARRMRVGITGAPGVGKSTTIDALGTYLTEKGHKVAGAGGRSLFGAHRRLDPRRQDPHGAALALDPNAFIRPSPASGTLGGVAAKTRETMLLCEAAGYDVILVETVGVGQSETAVSDMTDFFLVLMLPGAGDELQGIKKGVVELADMIAVNKADGDNVKRANARRRRLSRRAAYPHAALAEHWSPPVDDLFGAHRRRHRELWEQGARASPQAMNAVRRVRGAPARAAGEVDVVHAGGPHPLRLDCDARLAIRAARDRRRPTSPMARSRPRSPPRQIAEVLRVEMEATRPPHRLRPFPRRAL